MIRFLLPLLFSVTGALASELHHEVIPNAYLPDEKVELFWQAPEAEGTYPVLIIVHGYQGRNRRGASMITETGALDLLSSRRLIAIVFSQSGYGLTTGELDHAGKKSQTALRTVIRFAENLPGADRRKIVLYGSSMGASLAAITATQEPDLRAVILQNGIYDMRAGMTYLWFRSLNDPGPLRQLYQFLDEETGTGQAERSAALHPEKIKAEVLLLAGLGDDVALPDQALEFHEAIIDAGGRSRFYLFPFAGHAIPEYMKTPILTPFFDRIRKE